MWKVYTDIVGRMLTSLYSALYGASAAAGLAIWVAGEQFPVFSQYVESITGFGNHWFWVPLGLVVLHLFFKAIHDRNQKWEQELVERLTEIARGASVSATEKLSTQRADLERLRTLLAEEAHTGEYYLESYSWGRARGWAEKVRVILADNLKPELVEFWPPPPPVKQQEDFRSQLNQLRSLIVKLRPDDLRR